MIYLVEDDSNIRELVVYTLCSSGLDTLGFPSPSAFWLAAERELPDLILLDVMLPGEDGFSILQKLRLSPRTVSVPVIMLTPRWTSAISVQVCWIISPFRRRKSTHRFPHR